MEEPQRALLESPNFLEQTSSHRSWKPSIAEPPYIMTIANLASHYVTSTSATSNNLDIFDKSTLRKIQTLQGHNGGITSAHAVDNVGGVVRNCIVSSGRDGSVKVWDERSGSHSIKMTNLGQDRGLLCCDVSADGMTVAAGTELKGDDAILLYWDPRQPAAPLRMHTSTHSEDITTLSFSPVSYGPQVLLSGSSDGLVSISNPSEDDEDEATINVGNFGCSVSQAGWIHGAQPGQAAIWAASDMETFSTWTMEAEQLLNIDIRSPVLHQRRTWVTDYLVTAHSSPTSVPNLSVFTGSNEGDIALVSNANPSTSESPWYLHRLWTQGHSGVVRSLLWDEQNQKIVSGGEDGTLKTWDFSPLDPAELYSQQDGRGDVEMDVDETVSSPTSKGKRRDIDMNDEGRGKRPRKK
ncbi:WD40-repeat-containing domain protein [Panaeolus papilionaceus]|nr:WD40-repeat-containing domain protein [Panaeolus papilionaceus]